MTDVEIRAREAAQLLANPLLTEALDTLEKEATDAWIGTGLTATADRERHWMMIKVSRRLRAYLEGAVEDGRFAAARAVRTPLP